MKTDNLKLQELESEYTALTQKRNEVRNEIKRIETIEKIPALKASCEGNFFKYNNCDYSERRWFVYYFCKEITSEGAAIVDSFETNSEGESTFRTSVDTFPDFSFYKESTREEYISALREFNARLIRLGDSLSLNQA